MALLSERGETLTSQYVKPLGDGLWELRPEIAGVEFRIFYFFVGETAILLHAIKKKSKKTPTRAIKLARDRIKEYRP